MARVVPAKPRSTIAETTGGLQVSIPVQQNWFVILYFGIFVLVWVMLLAIFFVFDPPKGGDKLMGVVLLLMGFFIVYPWLWAIAGREVVTVDSNSLIVRREIFGLGRSKEFGLYDIRDLRAHEHLVPAWWRMYPLPSGLGSVSFDYGAKTYRFADALDEAEAKMIVQAIKQRFPSVARV